MPLPAARVHSGAPVSAISLKCMALPVCWHMPRCANTASCLSKAAAVDHTLMDEVDLLADRVVGIALDFVGL